MYARVGTVRVVAILALFAPLLRAFEQGGAELNYRQMGADWPGVCQTGKQQSPIDIPTPFLTPYDKPEYEPRFETLGTVDGATLFSTSTLSHVELVWNNVTSPMKVTLAADLFGNIFAPLHMYLGEGNIKRVAIEPKQFHFHTPGEATIDGVLFDGVIHIVTFVKDGESEYCDRIKAGGGLGCPVVIAILMTADDSIESSPLSSIFDTSDPVLVTHTGEEHGVPKPGPISLDSLLPKIGSIATYEGSLTTFPCTEGVFWISLLDPLVVKTKEISQLRQTVIDAIGPDCTSEKDGKCFPPRFPDNNRATQCSYWRVFRIGNAF